MPNRDEEYLTKRRQQLQLRQRIITLVSFLGFTGSIVFGAVPVIQQGIQHPHSGIISAEDEVRQQVRDYELVLQREPQNQKALEQLYFLHLKLNDFKGSMVFMEKLVKLHPDRQDYRTLLVRMKKLEG